MSAARTVLAAVVVLGIVALLGAAFVVIAHVLGPGWAAVIAHVLGPGWAAVIATAYLLFLGSLVVLGILKAQADRAQRGAR